MRALASSLARNLFLLSDTVGTNDVSGLNGRLVNAGSVWASEGSPIE